jgi:hypothetical protein
VNYCDYDFACVCAQAANKRQKEEIRFRTRLAFDALESRIYPVQQIIKVLHEAKKA